MAYSFENVPITTSQSDTDTNGFLIGKNIGYNVFVRVGVSRDDVYIVCLKDSANYYSWRFISLRSFHDYPVVRRNNTGSSTSTMNSDNMQLTIDGVTAYLSSGFSPPYMAGTISTIELLMPLYSEDVAVYPDTYNAIMTEFIGKMTDHDPYTNGGISTEGGGTGNFDATSDTISIPSMPTITGLNTGFFTAFTPTQAQLQSVSQYLWTNVISDILDINTGLKEKLDALKTIVANPYDAIMGCSLIPVAPTSGGSKELKMYGVVATGITLPYASSRWVDVDCGTLNVNEYWGAYLDYSPYTKTTSLYLPYIGTVSVDVDLIMSKALQIYYRVDILSGNCIAYILIDSSVKFSYHGNCAISIPITSADYSGAINAGLGLVGSVANIAAATGGLSAAAGAALKGAASAAISSAPSIASNVMGMKPDIKSGGSIGGAAGFLGVQKPYLIIERPKQSLPQDQYKFTGYPINMTMTVGECEGYTEFDMILLDGLTLTDTEKKELENIMQRGVYL